MRILISAFVAAVFLGLVSLGSDAKAENNPLLDIYKGIEIGDTRVSEVEVIIDSFESSESDIRRPLNGGTRKGGLIIGGAIITRWIWLDSRYIGPSTYYIGPLAQLTVYYHHDGLATRAVYEYAQLTVYHYPDDFVTGAVYEHNFLRTEKRLTKPPESEE